MILEIGGAIREQPRRFDPRRDVGQLPLDRLERRDRLAELLALLRVAQRRLVGALRQADRQRRDPDAAAVEHLQRVDEALPFLAEQLRRPARGSPRRCTSLVSLARMPSLFSFLPARIPGVPCSTTNAEMPRWPLVAVGDGHDDHHAADARRA